MSILQRKCVCMYVCRKERKLMCVRFSCAFVNKPVGRRRVCFATVDYLTSIFTIALIYFFNLRYQICLLKSDFFFKAYFTYYKINIENDRTFS